jgi:hypothetical protein
MGLAPMTHPPFYSYGGRASFENTLKMHHQRNLKTNV